MSRSQWLFWWFFSFLLFTSLLLTRPALAAEYQDSGYIEPVELTVEESIVCLHKDVHFVVYGLFPFLAAILILVLGCVWFYRTFIKI